MSLRPALKEDPVWTILPSYSMYQSTFYGEMRPPQYEESISGSESLSHASSKTALTSVSGSTPSPAPENAASSEPSLIVADENTCSWRETILDNSLNLRNFTESDNPVSNSIEISNHFTEDVGEPGKAPKHVDPVKFEYKQREYLNGYLILENKSNEPIHFEMFYVLFDGNFEVLNAEKSKSVHRIKKFLEIYDFATSSNESEVDRLLQRETDH